MSTTTKTKPTWQQKVDTFVAMYGPFTTKWDEFRSFRIVEGFLEVYWPGLKGKCPPLIEMEGKPRCACCGSARPMFFRNLKDRIGYVHMVGHECYTILCQMKQVQHTDFASQCYRNSEDKAG